MELSALFAPIWRRKWHVVVIAIITSLLMVLYSNFFAKPSFHSEIFFTIGYRDDQLPGQDYSYANYYGNYASIEFARTASAWPKDPYFVDDIYKRADVNKDEDQTLVDQLLGNFSVSREERANLSVKVRSRSEANLKKLSSAFITVFEERLTAYNLESATKYNVINESVSFYASLLAPNEAWPFGALLGLLLGILWSYFWEARQGSLSTAQQLEETFHQNIFWQKKGSKSTAAPIASLIQGSTGNILLVGNRINWKKLWRSLSYQFSQDIVFVDGSKKQHVKKYLHHSNNVSVHDTVPAKRKAHYVIVCDFPEQSDMIIGQETATTLVVAQRGRSRIHELQSLQYLIDTDSQDIYTILI